MPKDEFRSLMQAALAAQQSAKFDEADRLYTAALALQPNSFDALHMLGVLRLQAGDPEDALRLLIAALPHRPISFSPFVFNLKLSIAGVIRQRGMHLGPTDGAAKLAFWQFSRPGTLGHLPDPLPLVTVLLRPAERIENLVACVRSLVEQTYRHFEVLILDTGMADAFHVAITEMLSTAGITVKRVAANPTCLAETFDHALQLARGDYVTFIDAERDRYASPRLECFVRMLEHSPLKWGFSNIEFIDRAGSPIPFNSQHAVADLMRQLDRLYTHRTSFEGFLTHFPPLFIGNLFFQRGLWSRQAVPAGTDPETLGWAMSLHFGLASEPAYLDAPVFERWVNEASPDRTWNMTDREHTMLLDWESRAPALPHILNARAAALWRRSLEALDSRQLELAPLLRLVARLGHSVPGVDLAPGEARS
ncbi:MAG: glycosyltransferase [Pseudomonadota bacterium]